MSREVVEGFFKIPYSGQMRFQVKLENGIPVFQDGLREHDVYFFEHKWVTIYNYSEEPERHRHLQSLLGDITEFLESKQPYFRECYPFVGKVLGEDVTADGELTMQRFYV